MAIAGLLLTSSFQVKAITPSQIPSVQNCTWAKTKARKARRPRGGAEKFNAEAQRNNREEKKGAAAIAFEWERGYKKRAQRKRASHATRLGRGRRHRRMGRPAQKRSRR